jgi:hypothetical protein
MSVRDDYERRLAELSQRDAVRSYRELLLAMINPAFAKDQLGRTILVGLTAEETFEYLQLHDAIYGDDTATNDERWRYDELRKQIDEARRQNWEEYQRSRVSDVPKH